MPFYLHHSKTAEPQLTQFISLCFEKSTGDFSIFWYVVSQETRLALPHLLSVQVSSSSETNEHQIIGRLVLAGVLKNQAVALEGYGGFLFCAYYFS